MMNLRCKNSGAVMELLLLKPTEAVQSMSPPHGKIP